MGLLVHHVLGRQGGLDEPREGIHLVLIELVWQRDVAGCHIHDGDRRFLVLLQSLLHHPHSAAIAVTLEHGLDGAIVFLLVHELCETLYHACLAVVVKSLKAVVEDDVLVASILEKIVQVIRQADDRALGEASLHGVLIDVQHIAVQYQHRLDLREQVKFPVPFWYELFFLTHSI